MHQAMPFTLAVTHDLRLFRLRASISGLAAPQVYPNEHSSVTDGLAPASMGGLAAAYASSSSSSSSSSGHGGGGVWLPPPPTCTRNPSFLSPGPLIIGGVGDSGTSAVVTLTESAVSMRLCYDFGGSKVRA